jgi:hypothetical protein
MDQRAQYLIQILEKIGSPLMISILEGMPANEPGNIQREAQKIAELLGKTVQTSIELGRIIDISAMGEKGDSMRLALAAIASPLVASLFRRNGTTPDETALKKTIAALESVLSFSENFAPDPENTARLKDLEAHGQSADKYQVYIQYMNAFIPALNAISSFTFGQNEQKLVMDVSSRLSSRASDIRKNIFGHVDPALEKSVDLAILKALAEIYSACHLAEIRRISKLSDEERMAAGGLSLGPVWQLFEQRVAVLETLAENIVPADSKSQASTGTGGGTGPAAIKETPTPPPAPPSTPPPAPQPVVPSAPAAAAPPPASKPPAAAPQIFKSSKPATPVSASPPSQPAPVAAPVETPPPPPPVQSAPPAPASPPPAGNPMAAFVKKPVAPTPEQPPPAQAAPLPVQAPTPPPAETAPPVSQEPKPKGNPMAFFKPGAQKEDD